MLTVFDEDEKKKIYDIVYIICVFFPPFLSKIEEFVCTKKVEIVRYPYRVHLLRSITILIK